MHSSESTPNSSSDSPLYYKSYVSTPTELPQNWYHGEIDENKANYILTNSPGSFLVRKKSNGRFYLSHIDAKSSIKHLPITQLNSSFFFEGNRFDSLNDVVEYFKDTFLNRVDTQDTKYLTIHAYQSNDIDEMSAKRGDILSLCCTSDAEWMIGRNESTGDVGLIPTAHIEPLISEVDNLSQLPFFYNSVTTEAMYTNPVGSFLLRRSSKGADTYALLVKTQINLIEKFLIVGSPATGFLLSGRQFATIGHVLTRYSERAISGGVRLNHAVCLDKTEPEQHRFLSMTSVPSTSHPAEHQSDEDYSPDTHQQRHQKLMKTRRLFRGTTIDTSSSNYLSATTGSVGALPSPSTTVSTGIPEAMDRGDEDMDASSCLIASTNALRKSREEKPWKECLIMLSDQACGTSHLAIFDAIGSKRRQSIDLSSCMIFWLDESVFGSDGCLFVSPSYPQQPSMYLCLRPTSQFLEWTQMLRQRSTFQDVPPTGPKWSTCYKKTSQISLLFVDIEKYRSEGLKHDHLYSANVLLNGVKVCSSNCFAPATSNRSLNETPTVVIDSRFVLPCIPSCSHNIQLAIVAHSAGGKRGRPCGVSSLVNIPESSNSFVANQRHSADGFSFRVHRCRLPVLSIDRYAPLVEAMRNSPSLLFRQSSQVLPQQYKLFLYTCISYLYSIDSRQMSKVLRKIILDVLTSSTGNDVFRKDSLATGIVTQCLRHLFKTPFDEFLRENAAFLQAVKNINNGSNMEPIVELVVQFVDENLLMIELASKLLRIAAVCAGERFADEPHLVKRTLSAILILRVLNPMIFATMSAGTGSLLAKAVQASANSAASTADESTLTTSARIVRKMFDRLMEENREEEEMEPPILSETTVEWLACVAHLIGYAMTIEPTTSALTPPDEEEDYKMPLTLLELVRLHQ